MKSEDLFKLYEKQYYHEIEVRDKLNARLQIPLAVLVATIGFLGFMLQNKSPDVSGFGVALFWVAYGVSLVGVVFSVVFFRKSWFGHTDKLLPTAIETENYRQQLIDLYEPYESKDELVEEGLKKYLFNYYVEFSSQNTINNDSRSYNLYKMTVSLTTSAIFAFIAFVPYHFNGLDKDNHSKPIKVEIVSIPKN